MIGPPSGGAIRWTHPGADLAAPFHPGPETATRKTYVRGRRSETVPAYERLARRGLYPGIDIEYRGNQGSLEYDYIVSPGADPSRIRLRFAAGTRLTVLPNGSLESEAAGARYRHKAPVAYTTRNGARTPVKARFRRIGELEAGFAIGPYDRAQTLVVDPELIAVGLRGGSGNDELTVVPGASPNFRVGTTQSPDFPGLGVAARPNRDVLIQITLGSLPLLWVVGGSGDDRPLTAWRSFDYYLVGGETNSRDFPTASQTSAVFQPEYGGGASDGFLVGISARQPQFAPIQAGYLGGSGADRIKVVRALNTSTVVAGETDSPDFPGMKSFGVAARGQTDVFLLSSAFNTSGGFIYPLALRMFGGSGNDYLGGLETAGLFENGVFGTSVHVVGETESADFAPGTALNGPSDAFWIGMPLLSNSLGEPEFIRLYGGEGRDRFGALRFGSLAGQLKWTFGGETTSRTLPGTAARNSSYRGGTDIMAARFDIASRAWESHCFIGGSGDERLLGAGAYDSAGLAIAGSTESQDLVTADALQTAYGGGASDGLVALVRDSGAAETVSYFGGNGRDAATGICFGCAASSIAQPSFSRLILYGSTDSKEWPSAPAGVEIPASAGGTDWFEASVLVSRQPFPPQLDLAPGILTPLSLFLPIQPSAGTPVTLTAADASLVRLTNDARLTGSPSVEVRSLLQFGFTEAFAFPLADSGETSVRVALPSGETFTIPVAIGRVRAALPIEFFTAAQPVTIGVGDRLRISPRLEFVYRDRVSSFPAADASFPEIPSPIWRLEVLTPETVSFMVGDVVPQTVLEFSLSAGSFPTTFAARRPGPFRIRASIPGSSVEPVEVSGTVTHPRPFLSPLSVGVGRAAVQQVIASAPFMMRLVSADPSKLALSERGGEPASEVTLETTSPGQFAAYVAHGLAEGDVTVRAEVNGEFYREFQVRVLPLAVAMSRAVADGLAAGTETELGALALAHFDPLTGATVPVGGELRQSVRAAVRLRVSDPSVLRIAEEQVSVASGNATVLRVAALAPGTATVEITESTLPIAPKHKATEVSVRNRRTGRLGPFVVGQNLSTNVTVDVPLTEAQIRAGFRIVTTDPSKVQLSMAGSPPANSVSPFGPSPTFAIHGRTPGEAILNVEAAGAQPVPIRVRVWPAGYVFAAPEVRTRFGAVAAIDLTVHPIDPDSGLPGPAQGWSGELPRPEVTLADDSLASLAYAVRESGIGAPIGSVRLEPKALGSTMLTVRQPAGFAAASIRQSVPVIIGRGSLSLSVDRVGSNLQTAISVSAAPGATVRLTSGDPSRLVLSSDPNALGSGQITLTAPPGEPGVGVVIQSMGPVGPVTLRAEAENHDPAEATVFVDPSTWVWQAGNQGGNSIRMLSQQRATPVQAVTARIFNRTVASAQRQSLRAGFVASPVTATIANPSVLSLRESTAMATSGANTLSFEASALSPGQTEVALSTPGFAPAPGAFGVLRVTVAGPRIVLDNTSLSRDEQGSLTPRLEDAISPFQTNREFTVTSSDPSRLLVSADPLSAGSGAVTSILPAGASLATRIYLNALGNSGTVTLRITGDGFEPTSSTVTLSQSLLRFCCADASRPLTVGEAWRTVVSLVRENTEFSLANLRPGVSIPVRLSSDNPSVATVEPSEVIVATAAPTAPVSITPRTPGRASVVAAGPPEYQHPNPASQTVALTVSNPPLAYRGAGSVPRYGMVEGIVEIPNPRGAEVRIVSEDPSLIQFSAAENAPPQYDLALRVPAGSFQLRFWIHGVARSGSSRIRMSADGYADAIATVSHTNSAFVVQPESENRLTPLSAPSRLRVRLAGFDDAGRVLQIVRLSPLAGTVALDLTSQVPAVGRLDPSRVTIPPGAEGALVNFVPAAPGETLITIAQPSGYGQSAGLAIRVFPASFGFRQQALQVGRLLRTSVTVSASFQPTRDIVATLTSSNPGALALPFTRKSDRANVTGGAPNL